MKKPFQMKHAIRARLILGVLLAHAAGVMAFPPAPHHTLYGTIRNQWGELLNVRGAQVFIQAEGRAGVRSTITPSLEPGVNYTLKVPMDSLVRSDFYQSSALGGRQLFKLKVQIGSVAYVPIEMVTFSGELGQPAQSTRLNLTLGVDSDGDGLPDAWEEAIIAMLGGTLASITPDGDDDGDGISNLKEYLSGTLPFDASDGFRLTMIGPSGGAARLEFLAIRGRTYSLQSSTDLQHWTPVPFQIISGATAGPLQDSYLSTEVRLLQLEVPAESSATYRYFKAVVQ